METEELFIEEWYGMSRRTTKWHVRPAKTPIRLGGLRSAWASAQSDQSFRCPHEESLGL